MFMGLHVILSHSALKIGVLFVQGCVWEGIFSLRVQPTQICSAKHTASVREIHQCARQAFQIGIANQEWRLAKGFANEYAFVLLKNVTVKPSSFFEFSLLSDNDIMNDIGYREWIERWGNLTKILIDKQDLQRCGCDSCQQLYTTVKQYKSAL